MAKSEIFHIDLIVQMENMFFGPISSIHFHFFWETTVEGALIMTFLI